MATKSSPRIPQKSNKNTEGNKWANLLDELSTSASGPFFYPKAGKTRFRIVPIQHGGEEVEPQDFSYEVETTWQGRTKSRFLVRAVILGTDQGEISENFANKILPLVIPKSAFKSIIELLADDYELFDPEEGYGLTLNKTGSGKNTDYSILPSKSPHPINLEDYEDSGESMAEWAEQFAINQANRQDSSFSSQSDDDENGTGW